MEQEQILLWSHIPVITFLQFLDHFIMLNKHFSIGKGDCIHTLKSVIIVFGEPVSRPDLGALKRFDVRRIGHMWTGA
jgi:hypothetical protein